MCQKKSKNLVAFVLSVLYYLFAGIVQPFKKRLESARQNACFFFFGKYLFIYLFVCLFVLVQAAVILPISVLIASLNLLVVTVIWKDPFKELKGTRANYFILNLAICDLFFAMPGLLLIGICILLPSDDVFLAALITVVIVAPTASCLTILSLALERLIVISCPLRSTQNLTTRCLTLWIISIWFAAGLNLFLCYLIEVELHFPYGAHVSDVFGIISIIILVAIYTRIYFVVKRSLNLDITTLEERPTERLGLTENARTIERLKQKERSVARTTFMLVAIYVVCWIPLYVMNQIDESCKCIKHGFLLLLLRCLHPLLNPLAYSLCTAKFRRALLKIWNGLCQ